MRQGTLAGTLRGLRWWLASRDPQNSAAEWAGKANGSVRLTDHAGRSIAQGTPGPRAGALSGKVLVDTADDHGPDGFAVRCSTCRADLAAFLLELPSEAPVREEATRGS